MKRRILKLVVFLLLGAIVNVAVAWWCELSTTLTVNIGRINLDQEEAVWPKYLVDANWPPPVLAYREKVEGVGVRVTEMRSDPGTYNDSLSPETDELFIFSVIECGWPFRSLKVHWHGIFGPHREARMSETLARAGWYRGLTPPDFVPLYGPRGAHRLPIVPIAGGFAGNTILYASALWIVFGAPLTLHGIIRRYRRSNRGLCINCGYDLHGASGGGGGRVCPECGASGRSRRAMLGGQMPPILKESASAGVLGA